MTLTQAVVLTKKSVIGLVALTFLILLSYIGYKVWYQYVYLPNLPPVIEMPEMKFGSLPAVTFPPPGVTSTNYSYSLETTTGNLPQVPALLRVYFIPQTNVTLLAPDRAQNLAAVLGFPIGPDVLSPSEHRFTDNNGGNITINLTTGNFHFERPISTGSTEINPNAFSNQENMVNDFKSYLSSKGLLTSELSDGRSNIIFPANTATSSATAIASIWPTDFDKLPIVTSSTTEGLVKTIVTAFKNEQQKYISVDYTYWQVDQTTYSTYPLKTASQAFEELKSGKGHISKQPLNSKVSLTTLYLAYYQSEDYSPYLQPVFVFEGPDFTALVPAVATE